MVVRIIYRPSHPRIAATPNAGREDDRSIAPGTPGRAAAPAAKPASRLRRAALRSLALLLVRLGSGAFAMAAWRIAADLGLPLRFVIANGVFSHWQVWFGS